jgi:hypothetical protein
LPRFVARFPILKFRASFIGNTDYIDRITVKDMSDPIMIGVDNYRRPFIAIRYRCLQNTYEQFGQKVVSDLSREWVIVIFQRYIGDTISWNKAGDVSQSAPFMNGSGVSLSAEYKSLLLRNIECLVDDEFPVYMKHQSWSSDEEDAVHTQIKCKLSPDFRIG